MQRVPDRPSVAILRPVGGPTPGVATTLQQPSNGLDTGRPRRWVWASGWMAGATGSTLITE
jgi:hypothetical protein